MQNKEKPISNAGKFLVMSIAFFLAVIFILFVSKKIPDSKMVQAASMSIEHNQSTVVDFTGATLSASLALTILPDDYASSLANTLSGMNTYFIFLLGFIMVERLILTAGIGLACKLFLPLAFILLGLSYVFENPSIKRFSFKIAALALAIIFFVPLGTYAANSLGEEYLAYVDETIAETNEGANTINGIKDDDESDQTIFEKISDAFHSAIEGVKALLDYFKDLIKKCSNAIVIMIITVFLVPTVTFLLLLWFLSELFNIKLGKFSPRAFNGIQSLTRFKKGDRDYDDD